jgi:hypothetical protein
VKATGPYARPARSRSHIRACLPVSACRRRRRRALCSLCTRLYLRGARGVVDVHASVQAPAPQPTTCPLAPARSRSHAHACSRVPGLRVRAWESRRRRRALCSLCTQLYLRGARALVRCVRLRAGALSRQHARAHTPTRAGARVWTACARVGEQAAAAGSPGCAAHLQALELVAQLKPVTKKVSVPHYQFDYNRSRWFAGT